MAQLPDLHVSDSSEAMLSGRKPPFRLLVRAVASDGRKVNIRHAVSEGFVVRCFPQSHQNSLPQRCLPPASKHNEEVRARLLSRARPCRRCPRPPGSLAPPTRMPASCLVSALRGF